jgi:hypothetical protein
MRQTFARGFTYLALQTSYSKLLAGGDHQRIRAGLDEDGERCLIWVRPGLRRGSKWIGQGGIDRPES